MAKKIRTVDWCQQKILSVLSQQKEVRTYLAMSAQVLEKGVRSVEESRNLNKALANLIIKGLLKRGKDKDGFTLYQLIDKSGTKGQQDE